MAQYEYECTECKLRFEQRRTMDSRYDATCPKCGSSARLLISLSDFRFEQPCTVRYADGRIHSQIPRGGAVPPPRPPSPEQVDKEQSLQRGEI